MYSAGIGQGLLDVAGFLEATLKSSMRVDIPRHYERHFDKFRDAEIEIMEIGIHDGASLAIWKQFFTKATFIGVDINPNCRRFAGDRIKIEIGSQDDIEFLRRLISKYSPTIIIDDGSHIAHHIINTFEFLFPFVPQGGLYVIEDMYVHSLPQPNKWMGYSKIRPSDYLYDIVGQLFTERRDPALNHGMKGFLREQVEEIAFAPLGIAFIRKKADPIAIDERVEFAEDFAEQQSSPLVWVRVSEYILRNDGPPGNAIKAAQRAVDLAPSLALTYRTLASAFKKSQNYKDAVSAAATALELEPDNSENHDLLGQLYALSGNLPKAEEHYRAALSLREGDVFVRRRLDDVLRAQGKPPLPAKG